MQGVAILIAQEKGQAASRRNRAELIDQALRFVAQRGWSGPEQSFLQALAKFVTELLDVEYALIDRLADDRLSAQTVAFCAHGETLENCLYPLEDTPCANVMGKSLCIYRSGLREQFPRDAMLRDLGVESYAGVPLWNSAGEPIGLIAVMDVEALPDDDTVTSVLQIVAARAAYTLEAQRVNEERRQHEIVLAEAARLAKQRSLFIAELSHELRTPLNAILGCAQLLERRPDDAALQQRMNRIVRKSGEHLLALIEDLLDLARIDAGKLELRIGPVSLSSLLDAVTEICRVKAEEKKLQFLLARESDLPELVLGDAKRLRQVLLNLLGNAVKFTRDGAVLLRVTRCGAKLRFEVEDTGIGMSPEQCARLFRPFEQVGDVPSRSGGTGLGLAISQALVRLMQSEIQIKSEVGRGSVFWFDLELAEAGAAPTPGPSPARPHPGPLPQAGEGEGSQF